MNSSDPETGDRNLRAEWLETDGFGGYSSGTISTVRTRRYHGLLCPALTPPTGRTMLVNGVDVTVETPTGSFPLTAQRYEGGEDRPDLRVTVRQFESQPWPKWTIEIPGAVIEHELFCSHDRRTVTLTWKRIEGTDPMSMRVRPLLSGRSHHGLHVRNDVFRFAALETDGIVEWKPYDALPTIAAICDGSYVHDPHWYERFLYTEERDRGFPATEDLGSPGYFEMSLDGDAFITFAVASDATDLRSDSLSEEGGVTGLLRREEYAVRSAFKTPLERSASQYVTERGEGKTIIAGYPWFTDWGRDTFIAMRGLCLATGRIDEAEQIALQWAGSVSAGMLPNRFIDDGDAMEFNAVDASLWYVIVVHELLEARKKGGQKADADTAKILLKAAGSILDGYKNGTRFGIHMDEDGLIAAGQNGVQLTWMDAKAGDWVVTPRGGKPVEVQALWLNALWAMSHYDQRWIELFRRAERSFSEKFWNERKQCLYDVIDCDHHAGINDDSLRPNQIFAVGGLPIPIVEGRHAKSIVDTVEAALLTPMGLRTLDPNDPRYIGSYKGDVMRRDGAYHQGTVWPWLLGPFVEAWLRIRGNTTEAKAEAKLRFLDPLLARMTEAGRDHLCEIADGDPPHEARGCPFQAWSVGETLRILSLLS